MYQFDPETEDLKVTLSDGRDLGYAIYGNPKGFPIFYFHGFPGSRFEGKMFDAKMKDSPYALFALDRPGIGNSSQQKDRSLLTWADDILEFANKLNIVRFFVLGISGGGPYALACAYRIPSDRLVASLVVSGMGPLNGNKKYFGPLLRFGMTLAKMSRRMFRFIYRIIFYSQLKTEKRAAKTVKKMVLEFSPDEQALFHSSDLLEIFIADNYYGYVQGPLGTAQDVEIYAHSWGFKLEDIPEEISVMVLHGEKDNIVPVEIGRYVAEHIPHCYSQFYPEGTHFTTPVDHLQEILKKLMNFIEPRNFA
jgi:pimeloyl-ACP methyl ester carboxylesterase